jgi:hypothetical protein
MTATINASAAPSMTAPPAKTQPTGAPQGSPAAADKGRS